MYKVEFTPEPDPLAVEVFLRLSDPPSKYLDDDLTTQLAAAAASGTAPTPELIKLFASAGVCICKRVFSAQEADGELVGSICWVPFEPITKTASPSLQAEMSL